MRLSRLSDVVSRPRRSRRRHSFGAVSTAARPPAAIAGAGESLEPRTLLAAGNVCVITDATGADFAINAADNGIDRIVVAAGARVDELSILGGAADLRVTINAGAEVGNLVIDGGEGAETLAIYGTVVTEVAFGGRGGNDVLAVFDTAQTGRLEFIGGDGDDRAIIRGMVTGGTGGRRSLIDLGFGANFAAVVAGEDGRTEIGNRIDFNGDNSRFRFGPGVTIEELVIVPSFRNGIGPSQVEIDGLTVSNLLISNFRGFGVVLRSNDLTVTEDFEYSGAADQTTVLTGTTHVGGDFRFQSGSSDFADRVVLEDLSIGGDLRMFFNGADTRDSVRFGRTNVVGNVRIDADETLVIRETAAQTIGGDYTVILKPGFAGDRPQALISMYEGSTIGGDLTIAMVDTFDISASEVADASIISTNATVGGNVTITTGDEDDILHLRGMTVSTGGAVLTTGGGRDQLFLRTATVGALLEAELGDGDDFVDSTGLTVGSATFDGGPGLDRITDTTIGTQSNFEA